MLYFKNTKSNINGKNGVSSLQNRDIFFFKVEDIFPQKQL